MSAIYICHSSRDNAAAAELAERLRAQGHRSLFLDFDPEAGIPAGRNWERELYQKLRACQAVVVLCSVDSMASDWCFAEITHARALGKHIFPIMIAPCEPRSILRDLQIIDLATDVEAGYQRLWRGFEVAGLDPSNVFEWDGSRPPYPGLMAFQEADASVYFGRDDSIREALDVLNRVRRFGGANLIVCLGASGSGKSSLVRAGVLPRLERDTASWMVIDPVRPMREPLLDLATALRDAFAAVDESVTVDALQSRLNEGGDALVAIAGDLRRAARRPDASVLLTIDQFEEALEPTPTQEIATLTSLLANASASPHSPLMVLATLRSDFLHALQNHPRLGEQAFEAFTIPPLTVDQFAQIIEGPARVAGIELESGLTQTMIDDTRTIDALPLLAFTLRELWERHAGDARLTVEEYRDKLGGLDQSVARAAESVLAARAVSNDELEALRGAFVMLVRVNEEGQFARQVVRWSELPAAAHELLKRFITARLLVASGGEDERIVEVAHEALFRAWQRLKTWLDEDRHALRLRESIQHAATEWEEGARVGHLLVHRGARLEAAEALRGEPRFALGESANTYLDACLAERDAQAAAERAREQRRRRRLELTALGLFVGLVIVSALGLLAFDLWKDVREKLASLHWVTAVDARDRDNDGLLASHHFLQAATLTEDEASADNARLAATVHAAGLALERILAADAPIVAIDVDAAWRRIAVADASHAIHLWTLEDGQQLATMRHDDAIRGVVFGRDGETVLSWSSDRSARLWSARTGQQLALMRHDDAVRGAAFSRDGSAILTWGNGGGVKVWAAPSGTPRAAFAHERRVIGARFSNDGKRVLSWSRDGTAHIWSLAPAATQPIARLRHEDLAGLDASDDWTWLLTWDRSDALRVWRRHHAGEQAGYVQQHAIRVTRIEGARPLAGARRILSWDRDGRIQLLDAASGRPQATMRHGFLVRGAAPSRNEQRILSWSDDRTARIWDAANGDELVRLRHRAPVRGARFVADEQLVLTWSDDGRGQLWDSVTGQPLGLPMAHAARVRGAIADPQVRRIVTFSDDGSARLWRRAGERVPLLRLAHQHHIALAIYHADGKRVVSLAGPRISIWGTRGELDTEIEHAASVQSVAFSADPVRLYALGLDGILLIADEASDSVRRIAIPGATTRGSISADGRFVVAEVDKNTLRVFDAATGNAITPPLGHPSSQFGIIGYTIYEREQRLLSWGDDGSARWWRLSDGEPLLVLEHGRSVRGAALSSDGRLILTWPSHSRRPARAWDAATGEERFTLAHEAGVLGVTSHGDPARLLSWDATGLLRLWNRDGELESSFPHTGQVRGAQFSASGERVLAWYSDGSVRVWDVTADDPEVAPGMRHEAAVRGAVFSRDERWVLSWAENGVVRLWDARSGHPLTPALQHVAPGVEARFSDDERQILAWSGSLVQVWDLNSDAVPLGDTPQLNHVLRTATRLDVVGDIEVLTASEWEALHAQSSTWED